MYRPRGVEVLLACLGLIAVVRCAISPYPVPLRNSMEGSSIERDDHIHFDRLHSRFYQHRPHWNRPDASTVLSTYPDTYFFEHRPLFFADRHSRLSRAKLLQAYNHFGKVHVSNNEGTRFITVSQDIAQVGSATEPRIFDPGLNEFASGVRVLERHFGKAITLAAQGADLPGERNEHAGPLRIPSWGMVEALEPMPASPFFSVAYVRGLLRQQRYLKLTSHLDENIWLGLRLREHGSIQGRIYDEESLLMDELNTLLRG